MKKNRSFLLFCMLVLATACAPRERTVVLLSTNDIHARIDRFPQLASAVRACRDTMPDLFLVDAGDRWTGNAYVDRAEDRRPVLDLMNRLGYDAATVGNHEFDPGQGVLGHMFGIADFPIVCANLVSDTAAVPQPAPAVVIGKGGVSIGFVGVVTNYEGDGRPAGQEEVFRGLSFPDPKRAARAWADSLAGRCDVRVLLSHMGTSHDRELLADGSDYDVVIGGHSHEEIDGRVGHTLLTQTGKNLNNIGVTTLRLRDGRVVDSDFRLVPLDDYTPDAEFVELVERYYDDPAMHRRVGSFAGTATLTGLANLLAELTADATDAEVGLYHIGGVRLDSIPAGDVELATIFDLEPFGTTVCTARMTPEELRRLIRTKYNDPVNTKESHRIDLYATTPYEIVTDGTDAVDVRFPELVEGRRYRVAMSDYVYRKYEELHCTDGRETGIAVADLLLRELEDDSPVEPDNEPLQRVRCR